MFKRNMKKDFDRVFFKEFSEKINFAGIPLKAVVSEQEYQKLFSSRNKNDAGLIKKGIVISLKKRDLPLEIQAGEIVSINEEDFRVISVNCPDHVVKLVLESIGE